MNVTVSSYKKGGIAIYIPQKSFGIHYDARIPYQFPKHHPCHGCPYTLKSNIPSCMFPNRPDGSCFRYDLEREKKVRLSYAEQEAAQKILEFIKILEAVKRRKRFR
ncbi:hypothetical protein [Fumia xinanensis]|uniref:Uncharacterized protein n=1 Tax=Fumia xinanensis TaxID=2763659 RepID=A0A926E7A3_9FIRM|nr:hypothetical protein [Fumia xinanensis]MBC8560770.1 hypothetical protein [Fumia xinanensis]